MKNTLMALFLLTLGMAGNLNGQTASVPLPPPSYTLTIRSTQKVVKAGAKVIFQIAMKNTSDHPIGIDPDIRDDGYEVDVTTIDHGTVPDTELGRQWKGTHGMYPSTLRTMETINPGNASTGDLTISDLYDLSHPGKYLVTVHRATVKSNTIEITVIP